MDTKPPQRSGRFKTFFFACLFSALPGFVYLGAELSSGLEYVKLHQGPCHSNRSRTASQDAAAQDFNEAFQKGLAAATNETEELAFLKVRKATNDNGTKEQVNDPDCGGFGKSASLTGEGSQSEKSNQNSQASSFSFFFLFCFVYFKKRYKIHNLRTRRFYLGRWPVSDFWSSFSFGMGFGLGIVV